ncbi:hypothetical protein [Natronospora cellulosivora (SeqCode)]
MAIVKYENFIGDIYYLNKRKTKKGNLTYYFSKKKKDVVEKIPEGYEIDEKADGKVYLIKETPKIISGEEKKIIETSIKKYSNAKYYRVYVKKGVITVYLAQDNADSLMSFIGPFSDQKKLKKYLNYSSKMRFSLVDENTRIFKVERYCYRGSIDDWIYLDEGELKDLARVYCAHLGEDSFYDLI